MDSRDRFNRSLKDARVEDARLDGEGNEVAVRFLKAI